MSDWRTEFQYLLDNKILTRAELGYLFGQIKSIVDSEKAALQEEWTKAVKALNKYGQHSAICKKGGAIRCTCGLDEAAKAVQSTIANSQ